MVSPTTESGWVCPPGILASELFSTSKAAAVELSTPPLIATAIVMTGKSKFETRKWKMENGNWKFENAKVDAESKIQNPKS
jgi:hypothetical protein